MKTKSRILAFGISLFLMLTLSFSVFADGTDEAEEVNTAVGYPTVSAKAYVLMEATTGQILSENAADQKLPVTYLTKLMTLLLTIEAIESGKLTLKTEVTVSSRAGSMSSPVIWLNKGEKITVDELIKSITIGNANDASVALAEAVCGNEEEFVSQMNLKASQLGMTNTVFKNSTGIDIDGQYSTAKDIAILARELTKYDVLTPYFTTWMDNVRGGKTELVSTNLLVRSYNGITGMKAATSKLADNCLVATAKRNNLNLIVVILGCPSKDQRFTDAKNVLNYAFAANEMFSPEISKELLTPVEVKNGETHEVKICAERRTSLVISKGSVKNIQTKVIIDDKISAPVSKGQLIGRIEFYSGDKLLLQTNIVAENDVRKISVKIAFGKLLNYLLK